MSRKKSAKGKAVTSSPSAGSPAGKGAGKTARSSPGIVQMNGVVHPSRPSISNSSEFYDIAFKVGCLLFSKCTNKYNSQKWALISIINDQNNLIPRTGHRSR